jgi:hypothetical protein
MRPLHARLWLKTENQGRMTGFGARDGTTVATRTKWQWKKLLKLLKSCAKIFNKPAIVFGVWFAGAVPLLIKSGSAGNRNQENKKHL